MSGMSRGIPTNSPLVEAAFRTALLQQGRIVLLYAAVVCAGWAALLLAISLGRRGDAAALLPRSAWPEPAARRMLRVTFGLLWVLDGILQAQPQMPLGLPTQVVGSAAAGAPGWLAHLVGFGIAAWENHPIGAAVAAVWIQVGIGAWLLLAPRGPLSRAAGLASAGWALVVWVFGEAMGGLLQPGATWLYGAPGAVLVYAVVGALLALPEGSWGSPRLGVRLLRGIGVFFLAMALLQAWPGRGFWQGGPLSGMVRGMSGTPQPLPLSRLLGAFGGLAAAHGFAVNLAVVIALGGVGAALLIGGRARVPGVWAGVVLCLGTWVLVQDLGFFGGLGTDPNGGLPTALLLLGGLLAARPAAAPVPVPVAEAAVAEAAPAPAVRWTPVVALRAMAVAGAVGVTLLGTVPIALASVTSNASPILAQSLAGASLPQNAPAPGFRLVDQFGRRVGLESLRGKVVLLTFLDPVCTTQCPIIAQEMKAADRLLGPRAASRVAMVAIAANPVYRSTEVLRSFDRQERLGSLSNWLFLTGTRKQLERVWAAYGIEVQVVPGGAMVAHNDIAYVLDASGRIRWILNTDPGPGSAATRASFGALFAEYLNRVLGPSS